MEKSFDCIKIKDGLYLGNRLVASVDYKIIQDLEFLIINKFAFIVNCAAEVPNYFEQHGIMYQKFKITHDKKLPVFG